MTISVTFAAGDTDYVAKLNALIAQFNADIADGLATDANAVGEFQVTSITPAVGQAQLVAEGGPNGYGAGLSMKSRTSSGGTLVEMARLVADGEAAWNSTGSTQDASVSLYVTENGASVQRLLVQSAGHVVPGADNTQNFGSASRGWKELFCDNGTINTSDARWKTPVRAFTSAELAASKELAAAVGIYQFLLAVEQKGNAARLHVGATVQKAIEIMAKHGLNPFDYGFICHDQWDAVAAVEAVTQERDAEGNVTRAAMPAKPAQPAGDKFSFRPTELLFFVAAGQEQRLRALEAKVGV